MPGNENEKSIIVKLFEKVPLVFKILNQIFDIRNLKSSTSETTKGDRNRNRY